MVWAWIIAAQLIAGWAYGHIIEYAIHRWVFHTIGKKKGHPLSFHVHTHHKVCRRNAFFDFAYRKISTTEEFWGLLFLAILHSPIAFFAPYFYVAALYSICAYYITHRIAHLNPDWARKKLSHHYDHLMGPGKCMNANFGVRSDMIDRILGTRVRYYGTKQEKREWARRKLRSLQVRHAIQKRKERKAGKESNDV